jgi:hypothetical protein
MQAQPPPLLPLTRQPGRCWIAELLEAGELQHVTANRREALIAFGAASDGG